MQTWTPDNGNGTFSNPLFYDEFSDPDLIRVGDDYYLTGTTMHAMPGLPVLHSKDLVNWKFLSYACNRLDLGPEYRLEDGKSIYGKGIWAPCFRYHNGTFYIFSNVNGKRTQVFEAKNPAGPWTHREMKRGFHDLSVLFDDDGKAYVVWGYRDLHIAQLNDSLDDIVPGSEHTPFGPNAEIGEGSHFYKIDGTYVITCAWYAGKMRMGCARSKSVFGPYQVNPSISEGESFGIPSGYGVTTKQDGKFEIRSPYPNGSAGAMHQGGIVQIQSGEWWGWSMMDANSVGRLTCLSPVTWKDGWPYFGLPGNLGRSPRIWVKPNTRHSSPPETPFFRNDGFEGPDLKPIWQWNHVPDDSKWSLREREGMLRMHTAPANNLSQARNTLTQRAIGPASSPTIELEFQNLKPGDVAGLCLLNHPYAWIGVRRTNDGFELEAFDEAHNTASKVPISVGKVWLRASCDFFTEKAQFSYSLDGKSFQPLGDECTMIFQLTTFQGIRYGLFAFGSGGGFADFDNFTVDQPRPSGLTHLIPVGETVSLETWSHQSGIGIKDGKLSATPTPLPFKVVDRKLGRVSFQTADGLQISVAGADGSVTLEKPKPGNDQIFQWTEMPRGDILFMSLANHRHLRVTEEGLLRADAVGADPSRRNGASFSPKVITK